MMRKIVISTLLAVNCFSGPLGDCMGKVLQNKQVYQSYKQNAINLYNSSDKQAKAESYSEYLKIKRDYGLNITLEDMLALAFIKMTCASQLGIELPFED
jgi:hypothetical protein